METHGLGSHGSGSPDSGLVEIAREFLLAYRRDNSETFTINAVIVDLATTVRAA